VRVTAATVLGPELIAPTIRELALEATHEMATIAPGATHTVEQIREAQLLDAEMFERGVSSRSIYLSSVRKDKRTLAHVDWLNEQGAEVRTAAKLPIRMILVDNSVAVLPSNTVDAQDGIIVHRNAGTVLALSKLFEMTWASAIPLGMTRTPDQKRLTDEEHAILQLVALGKTDLQIGERIGMSDRSVRRRVHDLEQRMGANSRFETIYRAAKSGLI